MRDRGGSRRSGRRVLLVSGRRELSVLTQSQVEAFKRDGFLLGPKMLEDAEVETLRSETLRVIADREKAGPQPDVVRNLAGDAGEGREVWQIVNIWRASRPFRRLVNHPGIVAAIVQLSGAQELRLWHDQIQYKPAEVGGVNKWHQDWPYWSVLDAPAQVTAWVALDDADEENGCMSMVCGSHGWGNNVDFLHTLADLRAMPDEWSGRRLQVKTCPVRAGHVHFHHGLTWHGSSDNPSGRPRRAIALHYMTEQTRFKATGSHLLRSHIEVADGEVLKGKAFPLVYAQGAAVGYTFEGAV